MDQLLRITLDAIGRVTSNHEYRLKALEGHRPQAESCASDCSADGRRIKHGEASVQPAGPEQLLDNLRTLMKKEYAAWHSSTLMGFPEKELRVRRQIALEYKQMLAMIEGEAGGGQDDRSRPAG